MLTVSQMVVKVGGDTTGLQSALTGIKGMLGSALPLAAGAAIVGVAAIGAVSLKMAGDFQAGMTTLVTGAGEAQKNLGMVSNGILNMALNTGTTTKQLTDGMFMIESAGYHGAAGLQILQAAAEGAKVGAADLGTVANATTTIMVDYASSHVSAANAVNALVATVQHGKTHMEDLAGSLSGVLPAASAAHIGLNDVLGALATMTGEGVDAASASTYLRQTIIALNAPSKQAENALVSIGLTSTQVATEMHTSLPAALQLIQDHLKEHYTVGSPQYVAALKDIAGGMRQMQGLLDLTGDHLGTFGQNVTAITAQVKQGGNQIIGWNLVQQNFNFQVSKAREVVQVLMIELGEKLLPVATQLFAFFANNAIPTIQNFITFITGSSQQAEILRPVLITLAIAIGGALVASFVAWAVAAGAAAVATIAAAWPVYAIGAAIALLVAGIIIAVQHWGDITAALGNFKNMLGNVLGVVGNFVGGVLGWFGSLPGKLLQLGSQMIQSLAQGMANAAGSVRQAISNIPVIGGLASGIGNLIPHFASGGTMGAAGFAVVGERGPELVQLPGGAQVTPLAQGGGISGLPAGMSQAYGLASGASGGQPIQLTINVDGRRLAQIMAQHAPTVVRNATGVRGM